MHFACGKIIVSLRLAVASNLPLAGCIYISSNPYALFPPKQKTTLWVAMEGFDLHFACGKIIVSLRLAVASNLPPAGCIHIGSNPSSLFPPKQKTTLWVVFCFGGDGGI